MAIGERIKARREELGMTQQQLADRLGYKSKASINKIEIGKNGIAQKKIVDFANALQTSIEYLMEMDNNSDENSQQSVYYNDPETARRAEEMATNHELRALFDVQRNMDPEDLKALYGMALALKRKAERTDSDDPA